MCRLLKKTVLAGLILLYAFPAYAIQKDPYLPLRGKITCATIKCHISRNNGDRALYFTPEIYSIDHTFWGCTHNDKGEQVWLEEKCYSDCLAILDISTCSEVCAAIAHDIETMQIDIGNDLCN